MKKKIVGVVICALLFTLVFPATGSEKSSVSISTSTAIDWWPMFHHDLSHTGNSTSDAPESDMVKWSALGSGYLSCSAAVFEGSAYFTSLNYLRSINISSGLEQWKYSLGLQATMSSPAVYNGNVYVGGGLNCRVYCYRSDGYGLIWKTAGLGCNIRSSPAVTNGRVYIGADNGKLYCFDAEGNGDGTTDIFWSYQTGGSVCSSPAVVDDRVYFGSADKKVYCLSASDGSEIWNFTTQGSIWSSPAVADGKVFIGSNDQYVYCLFASNGTEVWKFLTGGLIRWNSPAVANGRVYIGSCDRILYCLNTEPIKIDDLVIPEVFWQFPTDGTLSSPAIADGKVYFGSTEGCLYCIDAMDGSYLWKHIFYCMGGPVPVYSPPAIADGRVYIGPDNGTLFCFGSNHPPETPLQPIGPSVGNINEDYQFSTTAVDPDNDLVQYGWEWTGDNIADKWTDDFYPSGETITQTLSWDIAGTYHLRVKANDQYGAESNWSSPHTITIVAPQLAIEVTMGVGLTTVIKNIGDGDAVHVQYSISFNGGFIISPTSGYVEGKIDRISAGGEETIQTFVVGLGRTTIEIEAETGTISDNETAHAFVFLFYLFQRSDSFTHFEICGQSGQYLTPR